VRRHDERSLDLYLLLRAKASTAPRTVPLPAVAWARRLGLAEEGGPAAVSKAWAWLARLDLVARGKSGRWADVALLHEDASGDAYEPHDGSAADPYFKLSFSYWSSPKRPGGPLRRRAPGAADAAGSVGCTPWELDHAVWQAHRSRAARKRRTR